MEPNWDLVSNMDGTLTLSLYTLSVDGATASVYAKITDTPLNILDDFLENVTFAEFAIPAGITNLALDWAQPCDAVSALLV